MFASIQIPLRKIQLSKLNNYQLTFNILYMIHGMHCIFYSNHHQISQFQQGKKPNKLIDANNQLYKLNIIKLILQYIQSKLNYMVRIYCLLKQHIYRQDKRRRIEFHLRIRYHCKINNGQVIDKWHRLMEQLQQYLDISYKKSIQKLLEEHNILMGRFINIHQLQDF